ncbi:hypothetical protein ZIOFF_034546 [Zingiber officinale]|uniref:ATP-dependent Clp protease proteolytic subunit n=1 Tax=Zingiber officinale TaxID=94328 RepID=A0A8J5GSS1_ZINOF|nr:hypothetical protein ZIOFF_034546 [Zingiber officinale]
MVALLAADTNGNCFAFPNSRIMVHQLSSMTYGSATHVAIHAKELLIRKKRLNTIYWHHTPVSLFERAMHGTRHLHVPEEAKLFGLVDKRSERFGSSWEFARCDNSLSMNNNNQILVPQAELEELLVQLSNSVK